jgi:hypothetical protein
LKYVERQKEKERRFEERSTEKLPGHFNVAHATFLSHERKSFFFKIQNDELKEQALAWSLLIFYFTLLT